MAYFCLMRFFFCVLPLLLAISCSREEKVPEGMLNEQEMVTFLVELHTAQAAVQNLRLPQDSAELLFLALEKDLVYELGFKDSSFYYSYSWYLDRPEKLFEIYTAVVDSLSLRESLVRGPEN